MTRFANGQHARPHARRIVLIFGGILVPAAVMADPVPGPLAVAAGCALVAATVRLTTLVWAAYRLPQRDREADDRLQVLADRACVPDVDLLEVHTTTWSSVAGQHALTINTATGHPESVRFAQAFFPPGSLVLVGRRASGVAAVDWMLPEELQAAHRHRERTCHERQRRTKRRERRMVRQLHADTSSTHAGAAPATGLP